MNAARRAKEERGPIRITLLLVVLRDSEADASEVPAFAKELELEPAAHSRLVVAIGLPELPLQVRLLEREVNLQLGDVPAQADLRVSPDRGGAEPR